MEKYNQFFIDSFDEVEYLNAINNPFKIIELSMYQENRYLANRKNKVNGESILLKESLDHYMVKRLLSDPHFDKETLFNNYVKKILETDINLSFNRSTPLHNHFLNVIDDETLKLYLSPESMEKLQQLRTKNTKRHDEIIKKIKENTLLTIDEFDFICDYYAFNRDVNDENHTLLIDYIFNTLTKEENEYLNSPFTSDTILAYLPKYFKIDNEAIAIDIRIVNDSNTNCMGIEWGPYITIERNQFLMIDFLNITDIQLPSEYCERSNSFTTFIQTGFHELVHSYQRKQLKNKTFTDSGFMSVAGHLLQKRLKDNDYNHDAYETEIDANQKGWIQCKDFFNDFIKDEQLKAHLTRSCLINSAKDHFKRTNYQKTGPVEFKNRITDAFDIIMLNEIIKENPNLITEYPMLKTFYNENGDLDLSFLKNPQLKNSVIGKNYTKYALINYPKQIQEMMIQTEEQTDFSQIVSTLYSAAMNESSRIKNHDFDYSTLVDDYYDDEIDFNYGHANKLDILSKYRLINRKINILENALNILNNPCIIKRKTNYFSPAIYAKKIADNLEEAKNEEIEIPERYQNIFGTKK